MAAYPFFHTVTSHVRCLLRLQENLGDRQIMARPGRHLLRSLVDWDVLGDAGEKGIYGRGARRPIEDPELTAWLMEAALRGGRAQSATQTSMFQSPALFPIILGPLPDSTVEASGRLDVSRQELDQDVVAVREVKKTAPTASIQ